MRTLTRKKRPIYASEKHPKNVYERICIYLKARIDELKTRADSKIEDNQNLWWFNDSLAFIDFLASHCADSKSTKTQFINFIEEWIYSNNDNIAIKANGKNLKLSQVLYSIARCGSLHNFSTSPFFYDEKLGYKNTIFVTNRAEKSQNEYHKEIVNVNLQDGNPTHQGIVIVAEDFVEDIEKCVNNIISALKSRSKKYTQLKKNLKNSFNVTCPPYSWYGYK